MKCVFKAIIIVLAIIIGTSGVATAAGNLNMPQASLYLDSYGVDILAIGNGQIAIEMDVNATGTMTQLGVHELYIEQKINGSWVEYGTVYGAVHSDFYTYNDSTYLGEYIFNGVAGRQYRVTMTAYARNSTGSDTGEVMSGAVTCRNP